MCAPRVLARQGPRKGRSGRLGTSALARAGVSLGPFIRPYGADKEVEGNTPRHSVQAVQDPSVRSWTAETPAHGCGRLELGLRSVGVGVRSGTAGPERTLKGRSDTCAWRMVAGALNLASDLWVWEYVQAVQDLSARSWAAATPAHGGGHRKLGLRLVGVLVRPGSAGPERMFMCRASRAWP